MDDWYLTLDQGGSSSRAAVFDAKGELVELVSQPVATQKPDLGRVEQVANEVSGSLGVCLQGLAIRLGKDIRRIQSAALVTQRSSIVCWNRKTGAVLSPVLSWQDRRAANWLHNAHLDAEWVRNKTGLFPNAHFGASKIRWCLDCLPAVQRAEKKGELVVGPLAAWLSWSSSGKGLLAVDAGNAARTMLYNLAQRDWDEELLQCFDIPRAVLPETSPNTRSWGNVTCGNFTIPLVLVNGDQCTAFSGLTAGRSDLAVINAGTGAFVALPLPDTEKAPQKLLQSLIFDDGKQQKYVAEGTVNGAGSALAMIEAETGCTLKDCQDIKGDIPLFLNGIGGLGSPYWQADFSSRFIGSGSGKSRVMAVLESIVFLLKRNLEELEKITRPETLVVSGGLSSFDLFCRKLAALTQCTVARPAGVESTAWGAARELAGQPDWKVDSVSFYPDKSEGSIVSRYQAWCRHMNAR